MSLTWWFPAFLQLWHNIGDTLDVIKEVKIALRESGIIITQSATVELLLHGEL